jgi:hypothetical protein
MMEMTYDARGTNLETDWECAGNALKSERG